MSQREDCLKFETGRIKALQEERLHIQKKTFTKWMNSFLGKARMEVEDLFVDLADGKKLLKLLEIISGEKLGKPNNGRMRVHKIENVNKSLAFLHTKVRLESIGAEDIVDGNPRLILGLIWTIILRFQIQEIEIDVDEENESSEKKSAKDALLLWCQRKTNGYAGVNIQDFTGSWRSGLGFNALIHAHRPDLIEYDSLIPTRHIDNLNNAFDVAERDLGIPRLLDAEDIDTAKPDEKSVLTYVASYYHTFARMKNEMKGGRRIANIVGQIMEADNLKHKYERLTTTLLEWIRITIEKLNERQFPNSLDGIQKELQKFKDYRTIEKPPKYKEKSEIEVNYFNINTRLKELNQPLYNPPEGQLVHDVEKAWVALEKAEHQRELALREELIRQTHLEQLAFRFEKKSVLREGYLKDMIQVLSDPRYGINLGQVEATLKKHEAISADILAREERCAQLTTMSDSLVKENYHGKDRIKKRADEIMNTWIKLLQLLDTHKINLGNFSNLMAMLREIDTISSTIKELEENFQSSDVGLHLLAVEDLLQKHSLLESQISSMGETLKRLNRQGQQYITAGLRENNVLQARLEKLSEEYAKLIKQSKARRAKLEDARSYFQFVQDHEEEEAWLVEKQRICKTGISAKDLRAVISLQQKHKAILDEMKARLPKSNKVIEAGQELLSSNPQESADIKGRIDSLQKHWNTLQELAAVKEKKLKDAAEAYQFYADANEADSWINEKRPLVASTDYGEDEPTAQALLQRNKDLQGEITAYEVDIKGLNSQAEKLKKAGISTLEMQEPETATEEEEWVQEQKLVPQDVWEEEPVERTEYKTVTEERAVPQVKALYGFEGQDIDMAKGEVMFLLNKTNADWWNVRRANGQDGFVPANYVKEIEPKVVQVQVRKPEVIKETKRVKKTKMILQNVTVKKQKTPKPAPRGPKRSVSDAEPVEKRQSRVNTGYQEIVQLAKKRHLYLEDAIHLFGFYRECDDFEKWITEKKKMLNTDDKHEGVENAKRKFEKFLTDLSASSRRIETIDNMVDEFVKSDHSQMDKVRARQRQIHMLWDELNQLKAMKERSLEGASSVELFNRTCDEAKDWMLEKMTQIDTDDMGMDLKTVQALQRRHQNLEREVAPIEEKVGRVNLLANSVKASYPNEKKNVDARQQEIQGLWEKLKKKAIDRRARLEEAVGQQIFMNSSKNLLNWVSDTKDALNAYEPARDVSTAEALLKKHQDLGDDMRAHEDEFEEIVKLGSSLIKRNPNAHEITDRLVQLREERSALHRGWQEKGDWLQQAMDLQMFNREADHIDTATSGHHAFLELDDLGSSLDEVEGLIKRHHDFENTLVAQDERLKIFDEMANKLIDARHYDSQNINDRRDQVLAKRQGVKDRAKERKQLLNISCKYHEFKTDVDDLKAWIADKAETASDESYKDLNNLERKVQKHEAFARELRANEMRLRSINRSGQKLMIENEMRKPDVEKMLDELNESWEKLRQLSDEKGNKLRQAEAQHSYYKTLENVRLRVEEMENQLKSKEMGTDRRACKENLKKHQLLESDMNQWDQKVEDLVRLGEEMIADGHFDAKNISKQAQDCKERLDALKDPAAQRRAALEELLRFYDFIFEVEAEMQWIKEHMASATSDTLPQDLHQAQTLFKKHKKLEQEIVGHQPMIDKSLAKGDTLIEQKHPESKNITSQCKMLSTAWVELQDAAKDRAKRLDLALKAQQFFYDASEVETWMNERSNLLSSKDYGKDKDASVKLLTKHKTLELEMDSYSGLVNEMGNMAQAMVNAKHPDSKVINNKQETIGQQMKNLQKLANERRKKLMENMQRHEYFWESEDFERWMDDQLQTAMSEDYGHDYEHLLMLQSKFNEFKLRVDSSSERFKMLDDLAKKLIAIGSPYGADMDKEGNHLQDDIPHLVSQKHAIICNKWNNLLAHIGARDQKLQAAGEIHRFNRDVADALARIQEKMSAIPEGVGRDVNSCESMLRLHESFENDLLALEAQLQVLVDDAARLQALYPTNAENIKEEQTLVIENWNELQNRAAVKKEEIQAACDFHRFSSAVRDLMNWATSLRNTMKTKENVRDTTSAQMLMAEHERLKGEIEAREEKFQNVFNLGQTMIQEDHSASADVKEKLELLALEKERLQLAWEEKKIYLDQLIDLHIFLRDAKQLDTLCSTQEVALNSSDVGTNVEEVDALVKKHDAFEKLMATQEEKFNLLQDQGGKLIRQNHFESKSVRTRMEEVAAHREKVKALCKARKIRLDDNLLYVQFIRDVIEAGAWIDEKKKKLEMDANHSSVVSLEDKIKKLKKHQAFEAELAANEPRIKQIIDKGKILKDKSHEKSKDIDAQLRHLLSEWNALLKESKNCGKGLEEAQDILDFNNQVEKVEQWIREKEILVGAGDIGRDYEHCQEIQRKLDDVNSDMRVDDQRIKNINSLAEKLLSQPKKDSSATKPIEERKLRLNSKWNDLKGSLESYRGKLAGALEIHAFNRDVDDTQSRIKEKMLTMSNDDLGKDLESVESLMRKQEALERDMSAISQKLQEITTEQSRLTKKYPESSDAILRKLSIVQESWSELSEACLKRREALTDSYTFQKFMKQLRELENWVEDMVDKMNSGELPSSNIEAEALLQLHNERKVEIEGRQEAFDSLKKSGLRLIKEGHSSKTELAHNVEHLDKLKQNLNDSLQQRDVKLKQAHQLQIFNKLAEEADSLLADKEAFLNNDDLGDSLSSVEVLLRKHNDFEKTMGVQFGRVEELEKFGKDLIDINHYSESTIKKRLKDIQTRQDKLRKAAEARKLKLFESKALHQFLRNVHEVEGWILEKMQIATDECYRDMTNLQSKIQKHQAFESELVANESRISAVYQEGEDLIVDKEHFATNEISNRLDELKNLWKQLQDATTLRKDRLQEAHQALLFNQNLDDLDIWMDDLEQQLESEDHGKDLGTVQHLLKKWLQLDADFTNHSEQIEQIKQTAVAFEKSNHFLKEEIKTRVEGILKRYQALQEPLHIRKDNLEDALKLYQFLRDLEDELQWMQEKEPVAHSTDLGSSLIAVQNLQKKHQALENEMQTHEPFIVTLATRGQQMIRSHHFASEQVSEKITEMQNMLTSLKDAAAIRKLRLIDAVQSQTFYTEASEAETWMKERKPYLSSTDYGKDEDSVLNLMKKLEVQQRDLSNFGNSVNKLQTLSQELVDRNHFDHENIKKNIEHIKESYSELQKLSDKRKQRLIDAKKLYKFLRESDEVGEWIQDQMNIAGSEDYGRDVEHVEILIQKFEAFMATLNNAGENRIAAVHNAGEQLVEEGHPDPEKITGKAKEIKQMWEEFKELANARHEALHGAKQVHMFDRTADETISWISEKDAAISSEDYGHDLESIQALVRKQQVFERDLAAVNEQVESVVSEAKRLAELFPDAREHIEVKHEETVEAWNELLVKSDQRKDKLNQAEQLQAYFDTYRELLAWVNETIAKVTAPELTKDVAGAEALIARHKEYKAEIRSKSDACKDFKSQGQQLIRDGHFLADEIEDKVTLLSQRWEYLQDIWEVRKEIYEQNLDAQIFLRDASHLELWLVSREPILRDETLGESVGEVEELLRRHEDFEKTIEAQGDKLDALKRITRIEEAFLTQRKKEQESKIAEAKRAEKERAEAIKRKEVQRITDERKREDERRRTQEIKFNRDELDRVNGDIINSSHSSDKLDENRLANENDASQWKQQSGGSNLFGDRLRRGSDPGLVLQPLLVVETPDGEVKRAESFRVENKKAKRTPSFTTRRRTQSFRKLKKMENLQDLPPVEIEGFLERKHELQSGGKRAAVRSWKNYFVVLCGQLVCFFKDREDFASSKAGTSPILIYQAKCEKATDYTKRKHVFRIKPSDGSEYLFAAETESAMEDWVKKITFHAQLPPSQQLTSYDSQLRLDESQGGNGDGINESPQKLRSLGLNLNSSSSMSPSYVQSAEHDGDASSSSSASQTPNTPRRALVQPRSREPLYANVDVLKDSEPRVVQKPPIPPRSSSIHDRNSRGDDQLSPNGSNRSSLSDVHKPTSQIGFQNGNGNGNGNADDIDGQWLKKRHSLDRVGHPPPLPVTSPPAHLLPTSGVRHSQYPNPPNQGGRHYVHNNPYHNVYTAATGGAPPSRNDLRSNKTASLPPGTMPPPQSTNTGSERRKLTSTLEGHRRASESSSESDSPTTHRAKDKKPSGLMGLFRRKKATQL